MAVSGKTAAKVIKAAAQRLNVAETKLSEASAKVDHLEEKLAAMEKEARARALATRIIVGDDMRSEIDERAEKIAKDNLDVVEKALDLGKTEAILKIGEALDSREFGNNTTDKNVLVDFLSTLK